MLADWRPDLFERRRLRSHRLQLRFTDLRDAEAEQAQSLTEL